MHSFPDLFDKVLHMFQTGPLPIIRSILTFRRLMSTIVDVPRR